MNMYLTDPRIFIWAMGTFVGIGSAVIIGAFPLVSIPVLGLLTLISIFKK